MLQSPQADVLVLVNWSGADIATLQVTLGAGPRYQSAVSPFAGLLPLKEEGGRQALALPVGATEVVVLRR